MYWRVIKKRLKDEGNETVTNCNSLKMKALDGKMRSTDVSDMQGIFRIIQSIPSQSMYNKNFNSVEFDRIKSEAGYN
ncbi:hypothetical protein MCANPG14_01916 [Mycoplasmopsis canis PG 14]|uniref:hypothetical protein n=1 Tax=Mycoplasmopsis canis TaxID=29555 RepID=UPI00025ADBD2|nr:hypothetical protein [Mycoplasmopsis canis]EIE39795.1 hypothetical protein MCANPG14_01916 [Mycoplasmopsis canis PG 14]